MCSQIYVLVQLFCKVKVKGSIELGYRCFHEDQSNKKLEKIQQLGDAFGYIFQYLNDLEPFSQKQLYEKHKGTKSKFDYGKKNIALVTLYQEIHDENEKTIFNQPNYDDILKLYQDYEIEKKILEKVNEKIAVIKKSLEELAIGDGAWVRAFTNLFNTAIEKKGWDGKIPPLELKETR